MKEAFRLFVAAVALMLSVSLATAASTPHHPLSELHPMDVPLNLSGQPIYDDTGAVTIDDDLDLSNNDLLNYFEAACPAGEAVQGVNEDGTFECVATSGDVGNVFVNETGDNMTGVLDMNDNRITGLADPSSSSDAVSQAWANTEYLNRDGSDSMNGDLDLDGNDLLNANTIGNGTDPVGFTSDIDLSGNAVRNYFGSACSSGEVVQDINNDGSFECVSPSSDVGNVFVNESGDNMTGQLNMTGHAINEIGELRLDGDTGITGGNLGIGTTSPNGRLDVGGGNIALSGGWLSNDGQAEGVAVDNAGNVGIGTASPSQQLHVQGDLNVTGTSYLDSIQLSSDTIEANTLQSQDGNVTFENDAGSERMRITDAGNVGIATTSPASRLTVAGNIRMTAGHSLISDAEIVLSPGSTEAVRVTSGGNVGIGTTTPASMLDVNGDMDLQGSLDMHQGSILNYYDSACSDGQAIADINDDGSFVCESVTGEASNLYVNITGDNMTGALNMTGNNINGVNNLEVTNRITDDGAVRYDNGQFRAVGGSGYAFTGDTDTTMLSPASDVMAFETGASERMRIDGSGNVGIGTQSPGQLLTVAGDAQIQGDLDVFGNITNTDVDNLNVNGSIMPPAAYDGVFDLGNGSRRWRNAYIGQNLYDGDGDNFFETGSLGAGQRVSGIASDGTISTSTISHDNLDGVTYNDHHGVGNAITWDGSNNIAVAANSINDSEVANNALTDSSLASGAVTATGSELDSSVAGSGIGYATGALTVSTGSTIDVDSDNVVVASNSLDDAEIVDDGLDNSSLSSNAVTASGAELDSSVAGNQLALNSGALDVSEGPGSGLDADTVDGKQANAFLELDGSDSMNGTLDVGGNNVALNGGRISNDGQSEGIAVDNSGNVGVGTDSPSSTMEVDGSFNASSGGSSMNVDANGDITITLGG